MISPYRHRRVDRRRALLLLVLTALTLFMMIGTLMLVIATRSRTAARAFSNAAASVSNDSLQARALLDEALMALIRGSKGPLPTPMTESILEDRYGTDILSGTALVSGTAVVRPLSIGPLKGQPPVLEVTLQGLRNSLGQLPHPCDLNGRILTFKPDPNDGDVASYRILRAITDGNGFTAYLANLPTSRSPVLPRRPCEVLVNGREFVVSGTSAAIEAFDSFAKDPWLARIPLDKSQPITSGSVRPSFGTEMNLAAGPPQRLACDNDNDGFADGIWIAGTTGFLSPRPSPLGGRISYEVSYLVLDLDARINLNAHGSLTPVMTGAGDWPPTMMSQDVSDVPIGLGYGPADVDASRVVATGSAARGVPGFPGTWSNLVVEGTAVSGSSTQRRAPPALAVPQGLYLVRQGQASLAQLDVWYFGDGRFAQSPRAATAGAATAFDFVRAETQRPGSTGAFVLDGARLMVSGPALPLTAARVEPAASNCFRWNDGLYCPAPRFARGARLDGVFASASTEGVTAVRAAFKADGSYEITRAASNRGAPPARERGRYEIDGNVLRLRPAGGGAPTALTVVPYDDGTPGPPPRRLFLGGTGLGRQ